MRGQKRVEDARERAYDPRIHRKKRFIQGDAGSSPAMTAGGSVLITAGLIRKKSDTDHRRRGAASISLTPGYGLERGIIMIWTSDSAGVLLFTIVGMFVVLSSMCIPA
jgi:hypothetical protein